jgi:ribosomal protein L30E
MPLNITLTIKKELKTKETIFGSKRALKKIDFIDKVYVAKDCPEDIKEKIEKSAKKQKTDIIFLEFSKEELKDICKKPFNISVLSIISGKKQKTEEKKEKKTKTKTKKETKTKTKAKTKKSTKKK